MTFRNWMIGGCAVAGAVAAAAPVCAQPAQAPSVAWQFTSLETADLGRAESFYVGALGLKRVLQLTPPGGPVTKVAYNASGDPRSAEPLLILIHHSAPTPAQNRSSGAKVGFRVPDARQAMARIRAAGFTVVAEAQDKPGAAMVQGVARDPDGVIVEIVEMKAP